MTGATKRSLMPVLMVNFIGALGFSIVMPFLVFLVRDFGGNGFIYGLVGATYPAFQFFGAPILGRWSDRFGRRKVLLISQAGTLLAWLIFAGALFLPADPLAVVTLPVVGEFTLTVPLLVIGLARAVDGLTGGNISVANAYVADISTDEDRNRNFGRMGVAFSTGMIMGPGLASALGALPYGTQGPVFAAALISVVGLAVIFFFMPHAESKATPTHARGHANHVHGPEHRDCHQVTKARDEHSTAAILGRSEVRYTLVLQFTILMAFNLYYAIFPVYAAESLEWEVERVGVYFMVLSVLMAIVEGPVLGWVSKLTSSTKLIVIGLFGMALHFVFLRFATGDMVFVATIIFALGNGVMWPSMVAFVSELADDEDQGTFQGLAGSASSVASIFGLILGGVAFAVFAVDAFLISAALMFVAAIAAMRLPRLVRTLATDRAGN